jgi:hypothetical protein
MTEEQIIYKSIRTHQLLGIIIVITLIPLGMIISDWAFPTNSSNLLLLLVVYLGLPLIVTLVGVIIGSHAKGQIEYNSPQWSFKSVQYEIDEAAKIERRHLIKFVRLAPNGYFWLFYIPLLILIGLLALPLYVSKIDPQFILYVTPVFAIALPLLFISSILLGLLATSNDASEDFHVPLIREAVWLGRKQSSIPGVESVHIVLDKASMGDFTIYDNPRTFIRLTGLGNVAYIETWSKELRAIESILCKYRQNEEKPQVVWWWVAQDRIFRKYVGDDKEGYYVKFPVQSKTEEYSVKDIELLTKNAVAIVYREWLKYNERNSTISETLNSLNASLE